MYSYKEKLNRIFFGHPPQFLLDVPEDLHAQAFAMQGMQHEYGGPLPDGIEHMNFEKFIQDIYEIDKDRPKEDDNIPLNIKQHLLGIYMRSEFFEWINDPSRSSQQKLNKCFLNLGVLRSFEKVRGIIVIDRQDEFVNDLIKYIQFFRAQLDSIGTYNTPKENTVKFKEILSTNQQSKLLEFIKTNNYVDRPESLIGFLIGKHDNLTITITEGCEAELSYLLYELYQADLIKLSSGKAYQQYLEMSLCPFSQKIEKGQIKSYVRKVQRNNSLKDTIGKDLSKFVKSLI